MEKNYTGSKYLDISSEDLVNDYNSHKDGIYITISDKTDNVTVHEIFTSKIQGYVYNYDQKSIKELYCYDLIQNEMNYPVKGNTVEYLDVCVKKPTQLKTSTDGNRNIVAQQLVPQKYDLNSLGKNFCVSITGRREVGKTTLAHKIVEYMCQKKSYSILIITKDDNEEYIYQNKLPDAQVEYEYDNLIVEKFINNHKGKNKIIVLEQMFHKNLNNNQYLDDLIDSRYEENLSFVFTFQRPKSKFLTKFTTAFVFRDDNLILQNQYYKSYGNNFSSFNLFHKVFMDYTKNYQAMVFEIKKMDELNAYYFSV